MISGTLHAPSPNNRHFRYLLLYHHVYFDLPQEIKDIIYAFMPTACRGLSGWRHVASPHLLGDVHIATKALYHGIARAIWRNPPRVQSYLFMERAQNPYCLTPMTQLLTREDRMGRWVYKDPCQFVAEAFFKIEPFAPMTVFVLFSTVMEVLAGLDRALRDLNILNRRFETQLGYLRTTWIISAGIRFSRRSRTVTHRWTSNSTYISTSHSRTIESTCVRAIDCIDARF